MILPYRKTQINKLAEYIANEFSDRNLTLINEIANFEDVPVYYDNYENAFDGMLLYDTESSDFHIHINIDNGNNQDSKRGRFTLAHELGHFFLDEHRLGLKYGLLEPHASFHNINHKSLIEEEADLARASSQLRYPLFVKPAKAGDSLGVDEHSLVHNREELQQKVNSLKAEYEQLLVEEYIAGRELYVSILGKQQSITDLYGLDPSP